ncbi:DUF4192 domain-containing protein [Gordonia sp. SL306]|uniref:DUF4192 domain-containing protein n=1 Tax=Gordonia sp. SL306 TaxID=2995145 RepID=UPI00226F201F|nr:DUF4192 domain-containing protein [Gordonia sp. SL306]WAC55221.1 DUF4192 domain-containing protein [Gordonia sp. SL306]
MSASIDSRSLSSSALLTAVPGLLGFIPDRSFILIAFGDDPHVVRTAMRHDLVLDESGEIVPALKSVFGDLAEVCVRNEIRDVVAVVADDRHPAGDDRYRRICAIADRRFAEIGGIAAGFVVPEFTDGARWQRIWDPRPPTARPMSTPPIARSASPRGRLGNPHTSPTAVHHAVATGRRVLARRSDMVAMLAPLDHCTGDHRDASQGEAGPASDAGLLRGVVEQVISTMPTPTGEVDRPRELDCATVTMLGTALTRLPVRDAALALAVTDLRHAAEMLWRELARRLTGSQRASAATLLAHLHYINGEGGYAGVALDCALAADPGWSLAVLLDSALRGGMPPRMLRAMLDDSYEIAHSLGVPMPAPTPELEAG